MVLLLELAREQLHLTVELPALERPRHLDDQLLLGEGLLNVVECAGAHGLDGILDRAVRGHHDHLGHRLRFLDAAQDVDAVVFTHPQIGDDHVVSAGGSVLATLLTARGFVNLVAGAA